MQPFSNKPCHRLRFTTRPGSDSRAKRRSGTLPALTRPVANPQAPQVFPSDHRRPRTIVTFLRLYSRLMNSVLYGNRLIEGSRHLFVSSKSHRPTSGTAKRRENPDSRTRTGTAFVPRLQNENEDFSDGTMPCPRATLLEFRSYSVAVPRRLDFCRE
jgi:hypothetical protein